MKIFESQLMQASREADLIDEVSDDLTYIAYLQNGDQTKALIKEIRKTGTVTTFKYPNGSLDFNQDWSQRAALTYNFKR